jgi:hypothetical protein
MTELLAALSLGTDLGMGHPMEHVLRQTYLALRLGEEIGLGADEREVVSHSSLMAWVGCHIDAYEQAKWFGDDCAMKHDVRSIDFGKPVESAAFVVRRIGNGRRLIDRAMLGATFLADGVKDMDAMLENHWRAADQLADRLGLGDVVRANIEQTFERWDGKGEPGAVKGADVLVASRLVNLADVVEVFHAAGGVDAAVGVAKARRGTQFDPALVDLFCERAAVIFAELDEVTGWDALMARHPSAMDSLTDGQLDTALEAIGDFVDLKAPFAIGHARNVADLATLAGREVGLPAAISCTHSSRAECSTRAAASVRGPARSLVASASTWRSPAAAASRRMSARSCSTSPSTNRRRTGSCPSVRPARRSPRRRTSTSWPA